MTLKIGLMNPSDKPSELMDALRTAFGPFTGAHALQVEGHYYGIAEGRIIPLF